MTIVERDGPLAALAEAWAGAAAGRGRLILVEGEAGYGKTTVVRTFCHDVEIARSGANQPRALWGGCEPIDPPRPLGPLHDFARTTGGGLGALMASVHSRHECFAAVLDLLASAPTLAVVEDAHWADDATLDMLLFLARRMRDCPSLLVVTIRPEEIDRSPRLRRAVAALVSLGAGRVALDALSRSAVGRLVTGTGLDPDVVHQVTGGHPFFVSELVASGADHGADPGVCTVPPSVRDVVLGRMAGLGRPARAVLEAASVVPDRIELDLLATMVGADAEAIAACEHARLLVSDRTAIRFRHELARMAVEESLTGSHRRRLHQAVVDALSRRPGPHATRLSHHAELAGDAMAVARFAPGAAAEASRVGAHREAIAHLTRALGHPDLLTPEQHASLLERSAAEHDRFASLPSALAHSQRAVGIRRRVGDPDPLAAQLARNAMYLWQSAQPAAARRAISEAVDVAAQAPGGRGEATAWTLDAYLRMLARDVDGAIEVGTRAIDLARRLGDGHLLARALNAVGSAHFLTEDADVGTTLLRESLAVAEAAGDDERVGSAMVNLGSSAGECRRYDIATPWLQRCRDWCDQRDVVGNRDYATAWQAKVALEQGRWADAERRASETSGSKSVIAQIVAATALARLAVRRGDNRAGSLLTEASQLADRSGDLQRTWPAAAARAEHAWLTGDGCTVLELVGDDFGRAVSLRHRWAIGELGYWLWRTGTLDDESRNVVAELAAAPFLAQVSGEPRRAAELWDRLGCPYEAALARYETDQPRELVRSIHALDRLGAAPLADLVAERLRELGGRRPPRPRRSTRSGPAGLTERQREIAALLAEGLTNAEIAARLHISPKTAGHHVSAILAKAGASSRREVARLMSSWDRADET